jgi:hypothetical protein
LTDLLAQVLHGTKLSITYTSFLKANALKEFWNNYSRILLPTLLSASVALLYNMFDPIRVFSITNKITGRLDLTRSFRWLFPSRGAGEQGTTVAASCRQAVTAMTSFDNAYDDVYARWPWNRR